MSTPPEPTFRWLRTGRETLEAMLEAINSATVSVRLEMYIFADSPVGERFREALMRACARGVRVRVLIDALGSLTLSESFWSPLQKAGGEFRWFNPLSLRRLAYRNHRKILVCDEGVAFTGGINIAPEYEGDGVTSGWCDLGLILGGPPPWRWRKRLTICSSRRKPGTSVFNRCAGLASRSLRAPSGSCF